MSKPDMFLSDPRKACYQVILRFMNVFFRNKTAEKVNYYVPFKNTTFKKVLSRSKMLVMILVAGVIIFQCFVRFDITEQLKTKTEFYGI